MDFMFRERTNPMLMYKNEMLTLTEIERINETEMERASSFDEDMEINCVFCGLLFDSIERVQTHITDVHENNNPASTHDSKDTVISVKSEPTLVTPLHVKPYLTSLGPTQEKLTVFDADMKIVDFEQIKLEQVKLCMRCNRHFLNDECLSLHQFREHAIRKRKRSSHPNCVEGIVVTLDGTWGCDICTRVFATLKQAKVHKFKSHIEPAQKQELLSNEFSRRYVTNDEQTGSTQQYRHILPNDAPANNVHLTMVGNSTSNISPSFANESETEANINVMDLSQSSSPIDLKQSPIWTVKLSDSQHTKISFSKVLEQRFISKEESSQRNNAFFAFNPATSQYVCSHCPAMFSSRAVYSRHILVHRRGKAFACDSCGMAFTRNHTLKQHKDAKCAITNPIVGTNCQASDRCPKCGTYFASSNSHLSHCKKICKVLFGNITEESMKDSVKSEETNAQYDGALEIDMEETDSSLLVSDFINNSAFVTKRTNEFNCNLCCCYFPSFKSIGHHLEHYHRINAKKRRVGDVSESSPLTPSYENVKKLSTEITEIKKEDNWWTRADDGVSASPPHKMLTPSNFTILPIVGITSAPEVLNLSTSSNHTPIRSTSFAAIEYRPRSARKMKVQPNCNGEFECTECHKAFGCRSSLSNHIKSHFNLKNKPFSCGNCSQGFMSSVSFDEHVKSLCPNVHGGSGGSMVSSSPGTVMYNVSGTNPSPSRATSCMHCHAAFHDRSLLEDHAAREHSNENGEVQCIRCTRSFSTYMAFRVHMTKSHGGPNGTPLKNSLSTTMTLPYLSPYSSMHNSGAPSSLMVSNATPSSLQHINGTPSSIQRGSGVPSYMLHINGISSSIQRSNSNTSLMEHNNGTPLSVHHDTTISTSHNVEPTSFPIVQHKCSTCSKEFCSTETLDHHKTICSTVDTTVSDTDPAIAMDRQTEITN